jgi:hypothetical protein
MTTFMVVCTFKPDTVMSEVFAVVEEEVAQVAVLAAEHRIGAIHLAMERGTVFLEIFAENAEAAADTVRTLPMAKWWDLDVFAVGSPTGPGGAA